MARMAKNTFPASPVMWYPITGRRQPAHAHRYQLLSCANGNTQWELSMCHNSLSDLIINVYWYLPLWPCVCTMQIIPLRMTCTSACDHFIAVRWYWHCVYLSGAAAAMLGWWACERFGRRAAMVAAALVYTAGVALGASAITTAQLVAGRLVVGAALGVVSTVGGTSQRKRKLAVQCNVETPCLATYVECMRGCMCCSWLA